MNTHVDISISIITYNEELNIKKCISSLKDLSSDIIVIDSGSTDGTLEFVKQQGIYLEHRNWTGHVDQKNYALSKCSNPWVLSLDADEMVSEELKNSIRKLFHLGEPKAAGYWINRKNYYLGKWIEHAWHPEWRLRLVKKELARWTGFNPHDKLEVFGTTKKLKGDLYHFSYQNLNDHLKRSLHYAKIGAESSPALPKFIPLKLIFSPFWRFFRILALKNGWRDGWRGWIIAYSSFLTCFAKYAFLYEKELFDQRREQDKPSRVKQDSI